VNSKALAALLSAQSVGERDWMAHCPGHLDTLPTLYFWDDSGRLHLRCSEG
jgi:hypothetical protein